MILVDYSDPEDDSQQKTELEDHGSGPRTTLATNPPLKRKRQERDDDAALRAVKPAPSLPANFHTLYATPGRASTSDDPSLHAGRQRQVPHVVGNWPSFVYLEWLPSEENLLCLERVVDEALRQLQAGSQSITASSKLQSSLRSELGVRLPLHISLSSPLTLTTDTKEAFEQEVTKAIRTARIHAFDVGVSGVRWVSNFDKTRHFLILNLTKPRGNQLQTLLSTCNNVARNFGLPELYAHKEGTAVGVQKQPSAPSNHQETINPTQAVDQFHISIAWTLAKPERSTCILDDELCEKLYGITLSFHDVLIKIGNILTNVHLRETTDTASMLSHQHGSSEARTLFEEQKTELLGTTQVHKMGR